MKKVLIFLTAILLPLLVFDMSANEPVEYTYSTEYEQKNNSGTLVTGGTCSVTGYDEDDFIGYGHVYWWNSKSMTFSVGINWLLN